MKKSAAQRWVNTHFLLIIIVVVGAFLRFHRLGDIEFNIDQVYPLWQALTTLEEGNFPLAGQGTSVLFANPTMTGYLFAPFLSLDRVPLMAYLVTLTLNSLAIFLTYRSLRRLIGPYSALVATALFAVSPWLIEDSRRTWVQSLLPFFVSLIFWALVPILTQQTARPQRRMLITMTITAIFANTYLLAYAIVAPIGTLMLIFWRRLPKRALWAGVAIFIGFLALYLIGLAQDWENTRDRAEEFFTGGSHLSDEALSHAVRLVTGWEYAAARGLDAPADDAELRADLHMPMHWLWVGTLALGVLKAGYILTTQWRRPSLARDAALTLLVWFGLPILMMSYVTRSVHNFYLIFTVPAGYGLAAWALVPLLERQTGRWLVAALVIFTGGINGLNSIRFAQETAAHPGEHLPYTLPLEEAIALGKEIDAAYEEGMTVYTPMDEWTPMVLAGDIFPVVEKSTPYEMMVIPPDGGLYMTFTPSNSTLEPPLHGQIADVPLGFSDGTRAALWIARQDFTPPHQRHIPSEIGISFIGWELRGTVAGGETGYLRTYWQVDDLAPKRIGWHYAPFVHVHNGTRSEDKVIHVIDGHLIPFQFLHEGDWIVQELAITIPSEYRGPLSLSVGLFDGVQMKPAIFYYPDENDEMIFTANLALVE